MSAVVGLLWRSVGWRGIAAGGCLILLGVFYWHYRALEARAERGEQAQQELQDLGERAAWLAMRTEEVARARDKAELLLSQWQSGKDAIIREVRKAGANAVAAVNPVCFPSADDRRVRNDAAQRLLGTSAVGAPVDLPARPNTADGSTLTSGVPGR